MTFDSLGFYRVVADVLELSEYAHNKPGFIERRHRYVCKLSKSQLRDEWERLKSKGVKFDFYFNDVEDTLILDSI